MNVSHIESKLSQRRNAGENVAEYINRAIWAQRFQKPNPPTFEDYRPFLTPEEIQEFEIMMVGKTKQEAEARARRAVEEQAEREAELREAKEQRERFLALTPEQQVAEFENGVSEGIDQLVDNINESIGSNAEQFIEDRLPWSLNNNYYDWQNELRDYVADIMREQIVNLSPAEAEIDDHILCGELDGLLDDFVSDTIGDALATIKVVCDGLESEKFQKRQAELIAEVKKVFDAKKTEAAESAHD